jgi:hypothetical protein
MKNNFLFKRSHEKIIFISGCDKIIIDKNEFKMKYKIYLWYNKKYKTILFGSIIKMVWIVLLYPRRGKRSVV